MQPTLLAQLAAWLDHRQYETGVKLYEQIHGPGFMLTMLRQGNDDYNRTKLTRALEDHHQRLATEQQERLEAYPDALLTDLNRGGSLMDERTVLKERLRLQFDQGVTEGEPLRDLAFQILAIRDQLATIYGRQHFFDEHGYLPTDEEAPESRAEGELLKRLLSVRTYVSRYQKKANQAPAGSPARDQALAKLHAYQQEAHQLQQQLDALNQTIAPYVPLLDE